MENNLTAKVLELLRRDYKGTTLELRELNVNLKNVFEALKVPKENTKVELQGISLATLKGDKGDKGEVGYTPEKGKDYFTQNDIDTFKISVTPVRGTDYFTASDITEFLSRATPKKGVHYFTEQDIKELLDLIPKPKDGTKGEKGDPGKDAPAVDLQKVADLVKIKAPTLDGKQIVELINAIIEADDKFKIDAKHIKGLRVVQNFYGGGTGGSGGSTTFLGLTDSPDTYVGQSLKGVRVNAGETALEFYTVVDTDEKVKVSANDTTAGYLNGKLVAGAGITLTENNNGGDETLSVILNLSTANVWLADQSVPDEAYGVGWNGSLEVPTKNAVYDKLELFAAGTGIDHGGLTGLADDDHTQYALLAGRAGGQVLIGGTAAGDDLTLQSTSNATKGSIFFGIAGTSLYDEVNDQLHINGVLSGKMTVTGSSTTLPALRVRAANGNTGNFFLIEDGSGGLILGLKAGGVTPELTLATNMIVNLPSTIKIGSDYSANFIEIVANGSGARQIQSYGGQALSLNPSGNHVVIQAAGSLLGVGTNSPSAKVHIIRTSEQLRVGYDTSNYFSTTVSSSGGVTFNAVGTGASFSFSDAVVLPAGTATAGTAPLKFVSGTSLTSAEAGAMEYTTDDLFFTIATGTARKRILMADPVGGLTSGRVPFATTNGRLTDDADMTFSVDTLTIAKLVASTSISAVAVVNNSGLAHGTYTPSVSAATNLDADPTMTEAQYMRVGNTVTVSGIFTANPTTNGNPTSFQITLPVSSDLQNVEDLAGVAFSGLPMQGAAVYGDTATNLAEIKWTAGDNNENVWSYTFTYQVI